MSEPILCLDSVNIEYRKNGDAVKAIENLSINLNERDRLVILGPSGCGKSTLLKAVAGFLKISSGKITYRNIELLESSPDRILIFQEFDQLFFWKTLSQNIEFALKVTGKSLCKKERKLIAKKSLEMVGLQDFIRAYPNTLSGGMKQRAAFARALSLEPGLLLLDEPFGALDDITRKKIQEDLLSLWEKLSFSFILVTHSIDEAIYLGNRILILSGRPGTPVIEIENTSLNDKLKVRRKIEHYINLGQESAHDEMTLDDKFVRKT